MAGACFVSNAHASLHQRFRLSQCIATAPAPYNKRRFIGASRCAAAEEQTALQLLTAAQKRAALRAAESSRKEPLFHDPYAACLAAVEETSNNVAHTAGEANGDDHVGGYELATSFIDDKLMESVRDGNMPIRQVVLLSDGMDTRPFRLPWPAASTVFDVSPSSTFSVAAERLEAVGARIQRGCMFRHVSVELTEDGDWEDESWERKLVSVGYQGHRPSIWAMQGLQTLTAEGLQVILRCISSLAMKDSVFLGELPYAALGDNISQEEIREALSRVFASNGFHVSLMLHEEISARAWSRNRPLADPTQLGEGVELVFVAKQLKLSDHQVDNLKRLISDREGIDEEGFEDW